MAVRFVAVIVLSLTSYVLVAGAAETYTNLAGNVIVATPVKVDGGKVTFDGAARCRTYVGEASLPPRKKGTTIPLRAFPASEQRRIKDAIDLREGRAPSRPMPGELKALAAEIASQRTRVEARTKAGRMTAEALAEYRENLAGSWAHAVGTSNLSEKEKSYWKGLCP